MVWHLKWSFHIFYIYLKCINLSVLTYSDMASTEESLPGGNCSFGKHLVCPVCIDAFKNPVTTACGHTFCEKCLQCNLKYNDMMCPLCKQLLSKKPNVNIVLRNIIDHMAKQVKKDEKEYTGVPGEVACDFCTQQKLRAEKSCLVCLASYCSTHLQNHSSNARLKGHKLVQPLNDLDERACLQHGRSLELFSRKEERCICVRCMEEVEEEVVSTEDEWNKKKVNNCLNCPIIFLNCALTDMHIYCHSHSTLCAVNWNFFSTGKDWKHQGRVGGENKEEKNTGGWDWCISEELHGKLHMIQTLLDWQGQVSLKTTVPPITKPIIWHLFSPLGALGIVNF